MKIRNGFVSNSSSSSYIISFDNMSKKQLERLFVNAYHSGEDTRICVFGMNNVIDELYRNHCSNDYNTTQDLAYFYKKVIMLDSNVKHGQNVARINISYGDDRSQDNLSFVNILDQEW